MSLRHTHPLTTHGFQATRAGERYRPSAVGYGFAAIADEPPGEIANFGGFTAIL